MTTIPVRTESRHIQYLDGLRGVAILMVITIHVSQLVHGLPGPVRDLTFYGVRGVQLFFIVSGLTLTISHQGRPLAIRDFAARRFFRIAPMFYLGALLYLTLGATTNLRFAPKEVTVGEVTETLLFIHGWSVEASNKIVPGGWSIAAEAMFYLTFPLILIQARRRLPFTAIMVASFFVAGITNIALRRFVPGDPAQIRGFAMSFWLCNFPAFVVGCWIALDWGKGFSVGISRAILALASLLLVADSQLRGRSNLLVAIVLLGAFVWASGVARPRWLESRAMTFLGKVSFSLYIVHFAIVALLALIAPMIEARLGSMPAYTLLFFLTLISGAAVAAQTYSFVEKPMIRLGRRLFS